MHLYMSGAPKNDVYQTVENRLNTHRLLSVHGDYRELAMQWATNLRNGIFTIDDYLAAFPQFHELIKIRDEKRRKQQRDFGGKTDWSTYELVADLTKKFEKPTHPKAVMLDSGAFSAWSLGQEISLDDVKRAYAQFIETADDLFEEIWLINLDVIPGEKKRTPTRDEIEAAMRQSDANFADLRAAFGNCVLPVYHQTESLERLDDVIAQVADTTNYIGISPRNDVPENERVKWASDVHAILQQQGCDVKTHGLATTGNKMMRSCHWHSGDSAAYVWHGAWGMVDIFHDDENSFGRRNAAHYKSYLITYENTKYDLTARVLMANGEYSTGLEMGLREDSAPHEIAAEFNRRGVRKMPFTDGKIKERDFHYHSLSETHQGYIRRRVERLGIPFEAMFCDNRLRSIVSMNETICFAENLENNGKKQQQKNLFGVI